MIFGTSEGSNSDHASDPPRQVVSDLPWCAKLYHNLPLPYQINRNVYPKLVVAKHTLHFVGSISWSFRWQSTYRHNIVMSNTIHIDSLVTFDRLNVHVKATYVCLYVLPRVESHHNIICWLRRIPSTCSNLSGDKSMTSLPKVIIQIP